MMHAPYPKIPSPQRPMTKAQYAQSVAGWWMSDPKDIAWHATAGKELDEDQWLNGEVALDNPLYEMGYRFMVINSIRLFGSTRKTRALARKQFGPYKQAAHAYVRDRGIRGFFRVSFLSLWFHADSLLIANPSTRGAIAATLLAGPQILFGAFRALGFLLAEIDKSNGGGTGGFR